MQVAVRLTLPRLHVAAVTAAAPAGCSHLVLVVAMGGPLEAVHAQHACVVHAWKTPKYYNLIIMIHLTFKVIFIQNYIRITGGALD